MKRQAVEIKDMESLSPIFKGKTGHWLAKQIMRLCAIDKINVVYENSYEYTGYHQKAGGHC